MTLEKLIGLNFSWAGRDWIIIQESAESNDSPVPRLMDVLDAARAFGSCEVLGFDGDTVYLK